MRYVIVDEFIQEMRRMNSVERMIIFYLASHSADGCVRLDIVRADITTVGVFDYRFFNALDRLKEIKVGVRIDDGARVDFPLVEVKRERYSVVQLQTDLMDIIFEAGKGLL